MKAVKIVVGMLASMFVLLHLLEMPNFLTKLSNTPEAYHASLWIGKGSSLFIGICVVIVCFKGKKKDEHKETSVTPPELP